MTYSPIPSTRRRVVFVLGSFCLPALAYTVGVVAIQGLLCMRPGLACGFSDSSNVVFALSAIAAGIFAYAVVVEVILGWPAVVLLSRRGLAHFPAICTLGALLGLTPYLVQCLLGGSCSGMPPDLLFVGGLAGVLSGGVLVLVQRRKWEEKKPT